MECTNCGRENPPEALFCMNCGVKFERKCPQCGAEYAEEAVFCVRCGVKLAEARRAPRQQVTSGTPQTEIAVPKLEDIYAKLQHSMPKSPSEKPQPTVVPAAEGENRILSILYGDISDSVAITERMLPEDAADLVSKCLKVMVDIILKYEGDINRFLGDCVLAFFGTPTIHENDPERAIQFTILRPIFTEF